MTASSFFFIDGSVQGKDSLFSGIDASAKSFVLHSTVEGVTQMQSILPPPHNLDSIQIISQGSTDANNIGNTLPNSTALPYYKTQFQDMGSSINQTGELLFFGWDIEIGDEGQKFITDLTNVTSADFNTFKDLTSTLNFSGNLPFEISNSYIETATIQPADFNNELVTLTIEEISTNDTPTVSYGNDTINSHSENDSDFRSDENELIVGGASDAGFESLNIIHNIKPSTKDVAKDLFFDEAGFVTVDTYNSTDTRGNSDSSTNHDDTNWNVTKSAYNDGTGNTNNNIDANNDGIIGALSSIDSSGSVNLSVDSVGNIFAGNVAVKSDSSTQIHTAIYGSEWTALAAETIGDVNTVLWQHESGALHTWQTDSNWQWVSSDGWWDSGSAEFDTAESNFGIDANNDGIIGALSSIELPAYEIFKEKIVPVICVCWDEESLYTSVDSFNIGLVGVTSITSTDFVV